ncbi:hypothetical protein TSOC_001236, partial [Tetrabaena socialis]
VRRLSQQLAWLVRQAAGQLRAAVTVVAVVVAAGWLAGVAVGAGSSDRRLTAFIRALGAAKLQDVGNGMSLLSLGTGVHFPDDVAKRRGALLVLDFYARLLGHMAQEKKRTWLLTGIPGTGKSWWIWYAMHSLLQQPEPPAIVWQTFKNPRRRVLFKDGVAYIGDLTAFGAELELDSTWYFVDGMLPVWVLARTVMVCPPERSVYQRWLEGNSSIELTMPLWRWPEVETCWEHLYRDTGLTLERAKCNFDLWYGGVPRLVLEEPASRSDGSRDMDIAVVAARFTDVKQVYLALGGQYDLNPDASHCVVHQDGDRSTFCKGPAVFATSTVAALFIDGVRRHSAQVLMLAERAGPLNNWASTRGPIFEACAHKDLLGGGCFEYKFLDVPFHAPGGCEPLSVSYTAAKAAALEAAAAGVGCASGAAAGQPLQLQLQLPSFGQPVLFAAGAASDISGFCTAASACSEPSYLLPTVFTHPASTHPACIFPDTLLQCTISPQREQIDEDILERHLECLPDQPVYYLDYVVPADVYPSFQVPDLERVHARVRKTVVRVVKMRLDSS